MLPAFVIKGLDRYLSYSQHEGLLECISSQVEAFHKAGMAGPTLGVAKYDQPLTFRLLLFEIIYIVKQVGLEKKGLYFWKHIS